MTQTIVLLLVLIFLNATFASAEIAVISMNDAKLKKMAGEGDRKAARLVALTEQPARFLATIQVAITLAGFLQSATAAEKFSTMFVNFLMGLGVEVSASVLKPVCLVLMTLVLAYFNLVFGELVPKRVAMKRSESLALGMSGLLYYVSKVFAPLVALLTASTNLVLRLLHINPEEEEDAVTEEEIRMLLSEGREKGTIPVEENQLIQNVFDFNDIHVEEICTHRREVTGLFSQDNEEIWEHVIGESRHTYYPIYGENKDDIIGILNTKDYFRAQKRERQYLMETAVEKPWFIPEGMKANVLFEQMQKNRSYFAVLVDEYGGFSGIITLHDLMEALVGELEEKEEEQRPQDLEVVGENCWKIQGCADLEEVAETLQVALPIDTYDTFNGYLCGLVGRVPDDGERFTCQDGALTIAVERVSGHRIEEALVTKEEDDKAGEV